MRMLFDQLGGSSGASFGLSVSAKATVLLLTAAAAGLALRRQSAAARHLLWAAALLGALAIPIVSRITPSWPLAVSMPQAILLCARSRADIAAEFGVSFALGSWLSCEDVAQRGDSRILAQPSCGDRSGRLVASPDHRVGCGHVRQPAAAGGGAPECSPHQPSRLPRGRPGVERVDLRSFPTSSVCAAAFGWCFRAPRPCR